MYTLQHADAFKEALKIGYLTGRSDTDVGYYEHYSWMREQMSKRLTNFTGDYPVWCHLGTISPIVEKLRIKAKVPRERILLSNYTEWEHILNFGPIAYNKDDYEELDKLLDRPITHIDQVPEIILNSWENIFDLKYETIGHEQDEEGYSWYKAGQIQACVDRIYISDIVDVTVKYGQQQLNQIGG